jgi:hypothetical protein
MRCNSPRPSLRGFRPRPDVLILYLRLPVPCRTQTIFPRNTLRLQCRHYCANTFPPPPPPVVVPPIAEALTAGLAVFSNSPMSHCSIVCGSDTPCTPPGWNAKKKHTIARKSMRMAIASLVPSPIFHAPFSNLAQFYCAGIAGHL